jgi:hypothetical protein
MINRDEVVMDYVRVPQKHSLRDCRKQYKQLVPSWDLNWVPSNVNGTGYHCVIQLIKYSS